ncbi:cytochrome c [Microbulbifer sp. CAU 1566]|uniref:cytochrome c n=1 Tax=Microbulbifer sp. CAU 1566 TaxID=2933269 RepID=UPI0020053C7D|nr:cytochrome c [Microbulbifer sp. CAU 1566]MCK7598018.1 cytochrome c [Microbulbifer sp. CAU 1566]
MHWRLALTGLVCALLPLAWLSAQEIWDQAAVSEVNTELNQPALIEKGRYLAIAGDCQACHTKPGGTAFAGGRGLEIPKLGTLYSSNITPDINTGIGGWKLEEFERALRRGIGKNGRNLYPAMPYESYAKITDEDIEALYAYFLFGIEPVHEAPPANKIPRLLSARWPLAIWNFLFRPSGPFEPSPDQGAEWNRGAYLVQGLAHCGECHTPRGIALQEKAYDEKGKGYLSGGPVLDGWEAYNITPDPVSGIGDWTSAQLQQYLKTGHVNRLAQAGGPMAEAIENSFAKMTDADIRAMVTYLRSIPPVSGKNRVARQARGTPATDVIIKRGNLLAIDRSPVLRSDGARLYLGLCASCHGVDGGGSNDGHYPSLIRNSTVGAASEHNLRQAILQGISRTVNGEEKMMPGFASELSEEDLSKLLEYLRRQFAAPPPSDASVKIDQAASPQTAIP